jgi:hypothetical protein
MNSTGPVSSRSERPLDDVEVVRAPVAELAAAVFPVAAPAAAVVALHPVFRILEKRRGAEPAVVIETLGHGDDLFLFRRLRETRPSWQ